MLSNVKVGDRVRSCLRGWGTVTCVEPEYVHGVVVSFDKFDIDGDRFLKDGRSQLQHLHPEIVEVQKKKWEPEGGNFYIDADGEVWYVACGSKPDSYINEGRAYPSRELAEKAHKMIRRFQRLVAYVLEHAPDYESDWEDDGQYTYCIVYNHDFKQWEITGKLFTEYFTVPMPISVAEELCEKLNSGEVEL